MDPKLPCAQAVFSSPAPWSVSDFRRKRESGEGVTRNLSKHFSKGSVHLLCPQKCLPVGFGSPLPPFGRQKTQQRLSDQNPKTDEITRLFLCGSPTSQQQHQGRGEHSPSCIALHCLAYELARSTQVSRSALRARLEKFRAVKLSFPSTLAKRTKYASLALCPLLTAHGPELVILSCST